MQMQLRLLQYFLFLLEKAKVMQNLILGLNNTFENLGATQATLQLHEPRIFYPSGHWPETVTNSHVSANLRYSLGASVISTHIRTEGLYVKTIIIHQLKRPCIPDCAYTENMFINSIHISLYVISHTQNILYQIKKTWLYERDSDAPSVISEPGGK